MFHDIIRAYADAMYVATTLRPPAAAPARDSAGDGESLRRPGFLRRWWRGLGVGGAAVPALPIRPSVVRAPCP